MCAERAKQPVLLLPSKADGVCDIVCEPLVGMHTVDDLRIKHRGLPRYCRGEALNGCVPDVPKQRVLGCWEAELEPGDKLGRSARDGIRG